MKNPLTTVQMLHKIGKVLSSVIFALSIILFVFFLVAAGVIHNAIEGGKTMQSVFKEDAHFTLEALYGLSAVLALFSLGEIFLSKTARGYFALELEKGTPFNEECAKKLKTLGISAIIITLIEYCSSSVLYSFLMKKYGNMEPLELRAAGSAVLGVMFIILSLFSRYGADLEEKNRK